MTQNPTPTPAAAPPAAWRLQEEQNERVGNMMALVGQRRQLVGEIERLQDRRADLALRMKGATSGERIILERTAGEVEQQITGAQNALLGIDRMIAVTNGGTNPTKVARATPAPAAPVKAGGAVTVQPDGPAGWSVSARDATVFGVAGVAMLALAFLAGMNYLRRVRRQTTEAVVQLRSELSEELRKVAHGVEAVAVEVERIGEGQRYVTKALADKKEPIRS
jgi:hypothetical protein